MKTNSKRGMVPDTPPGEGRNLDWSKSQRVIFANLKPSTQSISLRLPEGLLDQIKVAANRRDVPYQSFINVLLAEAMQKEKQRKQRVA